MYTKKIIFGFYSLLLFGTACTKFKTVNEDKKSIDTIATAKDNRQLVRNENLRELKCGLWMNDKGDIMFEDLAAVAPNDAEDATDFEFYYIYKIYNELDSANDYETNLRDIVDTLTFQSVGDYCFKDKNHVYIHHSMAYGGTLRIDYSIDSETFHKLGNGAYTRDKDQCFNFGKKLENADPKTFRILATGDMPIGRDKNHFYAWDNVMTDEDIMNYEKDTGIDLRKL